MDIICPSCGFQRQVSADRLPARTVIATCPHCACRFRFQLGAGVLEVLSEKQDEQKNSGESTAPDPEQQPAAIPRPDSAKPEAPLPPVDAASQEGEEASARADTPAEAPAADRGTGQPDKPDSILPHEESESQAGIADSHNPWESAPEPYGWFSAFYQTCLRVMFSAQNFFLTLRPNVSQQRALLFYLLVSVIQILTERLWSELLLSFLAPSLSSDPELAAMLAMLSSQMSIPMLLLLKTAVSIAQLYILSALLHFGYGLLLGKRSDFVLLFQVVAYSAAPAMLCLVPLLGSLVGLFWTFACLLVGCRTVLGLSWAQTFMGFIPVLLLLSPLFLQILQALQ